MNKPERPPGRPHLDGSRPGQGERVVTKCITLPNGMAEYLKWKVGYGNLSKAVRVVAEYYRLDVDPEFDFNEVSKYTSDHD